LRCRCYKDFAPTELEIASAESWPERDYAFQSHALATSSNGPFGQPIARHRKRITIDAMAPTRLNPQVDEYLKNAKKWQEESKKLRRIILDCGLTEESKWGKPCYTFQNSNVVIIQGFKEYCALLFCKGALLKDAHRILIQQTENVQAARQIRFTSVPEIVAMEPTVKAYIHEAVEVEKAGLEVNYKKTSEFTVPEELQSKLDEIPAFKKAFKALTPGRQRGYLLYFSAPKQSKTREARIEKSMPQILKGQGLNDD
jgi:uncharacterized protein YdeI (YjbR/CyaY-like superfamily)